MTTLKRRLNITLTSDVEKLVSHMAKRDKVPQATKISELLKISLMLEEDRAFSILGDQRLNEKSEKLSHKEVWG